MSRVSRVRASSPRCGMLTCRLLRRCRLRLLPPEFQCGSAAIVAVVGPPWSLPDPTAHSVIVGALPASSLGGSAGPAAWARVPAQLIRCWVGLTPEKLADCIKSRGSLGPAFLVPRATRCATHHQRFAALCKWPVLSRASFTSAWLLSLALPFHASTPKYNTLASIMGSAS